MSFDFTVERNSSKWVLGADGYLKEYIADAAAIEFNADGSYKGVLVEPASTNICLQSEDFTTTWSPSNATITANATTAPDGTTTADKLGDDGGGGTGVVYARQDITVSAATKYTASVFLKADQLAFARFKVDGYDGATDGDQYFGLSGSGTLGTASNLDDRKIEAYPNGWYRCSVTFTMGASDTSFNFRIYVADSISNSTVPLDGTSSIYVWGAQVEESPIATSYIPTTTGSVTRLKDDIYLTSASSLIGQTEGTMFVEVDFRQTGLDQRILQISDGTGANRALIWAFSTNTYMQITSGGSTVVNMAVSSLADGVQKLAFAYANNDQEFYRNGSSVATDTGSLAGLSTLTDIDFGQSSVAANQANMWIRAVALFTTRLSAAEISQLTVTPSAQQFIFNLSNEVFSTSTLTFS